MDIVGAQRRCALCHTITQRRCALCHTITQRRCALCHTITQRCCALCHTITHPCQPSPPQIDHFVYDLYDLTPEEIKIVEGG